MTSQRCVLVIDDDLDVGELVAETARGMGLSCSTTSSAASFLEMLNPNTGLILLDLVMPGMDGIELLRFLGDRKCTANIVLMTGVGKRVIQSASQLAEVLGLSIVGHLQKPFRIRELEGFLTRFVEQQPHVAVPQSPFLPIYDDELRAAVDRNQFILHYQPQIDISTRTVTGLEALVRWQHPIHGLVYPDHFIARAESLEIIDALSWSVFARGLSDLPSFAAISGTLPTLAINISVHSLHDLQLPDKAAALAAAHNIPLDRLVFEITESGLIQELPNALDVLTRLRMKQIGLSIDDFGTGYSMMQQLQLIPATELKIDKSFVQNMFCDDSSRILVLKTIEIGHELGLKVIAEGVETVEQLVFLRKHGCEIAQGYLFSRPLPPEALRTWLQNYRTTPPPA